MPSTPQGLKLDLSIHWRVHHYSKLPRAHQSRRTRCGRPPPFHPVNLTILFAALAGTPPQPGVLAPGDHHPQPPEVRPHHGGGQHDLHAEAHQGGLGCGCCGAEDGRENKKQRRRDEAGGRNDFVLFVVLLYEFMDRTRLCSPPVCQPLHYGFFLKRCATYRQHVYRHWLEIWCLAWLPI